MKFNQFENIGRATIVPSMTKSISRTNSGGSNKKRKRSNKSRVSNSIRVVKGRVVLRVPGYQGVQKLSPSHLIQHINKKNLKSAAKNVLNTKQGRKRKSKKGRKGRKRGKGGRKK